VSQLPLRNPELAGFALAARTCGLRLLAGLSRHVRLELSFPDLTVPQQRVRIVDWRRFAYSTFPLKECQINGLCSIEEGGETGKPSGAAG
jgi:hypothetical protein